MPILVVAWGVTTPAWSLAQPLDVRIVTIDDLTKESLAPLKRIRIPLRVNVDAQVNISGTDV